MEGTPRPRLFHELVLQIDATARQMEREERLLVFCTGNLEENGNLNMTLEKAVGAGGLTDVRFLLASGDFKQHNLDDALCIAAENGHVETVALLLDRGAQVWDAEDTDGEELPDNALECAIRNKHDEVVAMLLG